MLTIEELKYTFFFFIGVWIVVKVTKGGTRTIQKMILKIEWRLFTI